MPWSGQVQLQVRAHASARAAFASQTNRGGSMNYPITMLFHVSMAPGIVNQRRRPWPFRGGLRSGYAYIVLFSLQDADRDLLRRF